MSIHDGHRRRLKARFMSEGLDAFEEHNILELVLFYAIPMKDTNPVAHALMARFGSLAAVLDAPAGELMKVGGVGENTAMLLKLLPELSRRYMLSRSSVGNCLDTAKKAGEFLIPLFHGRRDEVVYLICLDAKCKILGSHLLFEGNVNSAHVSVRKVVETALVSNSTSVIIAHNHTSGVALPSEDDRKTTDKVASALKAVGIKLLDHIIVADDDFVSMVESGMLG